MITQADLDNGQDAALQQIDQMDAAQLDHDARFCHIWAGARPALEALRTYLPGIGPMIAGVLLAIGDGVANKVGCNQ